MVHRWHTHRYVRADSLIVYHWPGRSGNTVNGWRRFCGKSRFPLLTVYTGIGTYSCSGIRNGPERRAAAVHRLYFSLACLTPRLVYTPYTHSHRPAINVFPHVCSLQPCTIIVLFHFFRRLPFYYQNVPIVPENGNIGVGGGGLREVRRKLFCIRKYYYVYADKFICNAAVRFCFPLVQCMRSIHMSQILTGWTISLTNGNSRYVFRISISSIGINKFPWNVETFLMRFLFLSRSYSF